MNPPPKIKPTPYMEEYNRRYGHSPAGANLRMLGRALLVMLAFLLIFGTPVVFFILYYMNRK